MKPRHQVSRAAIELIERFEGYRRKAAQLPDGRWTIGYGHTLSAREGAEVSEEDAEALLIYDLIAVAHTVNELTHAALSQNQFDALCAFAFNIGLEAFQGSQVLKRLNEGAYLQAACAMELWRKAEFQGEAIVIDALVRRRSAEKTLFLTPEGAWPVAPSPVLRPQIDADAAPLVPAQEPTPLVADLDGEHTTLRREGELEPEPIPGQPIEDASPVSAAAEAVTARLEILFREDDGPSERAAVDEDAFALSPPEPELEPEPPLDGIAAETETEAEGESTSPDLFEPPPPANDPMAAELLDTGEPQPEAAEPGETVEVPEPARERVIIDDTAPFEFVPAQVQPLPHRSGEGFFSLVVLAIVGLAFLAGGLFWATNAQPGAEPSFLTPRLVGALASIAGVGLFSITVYLLLQRLGRAAERDEDRGP